MHELEREVLSFIRKWDLIGSGQKVLLAVSGGKDSMVLLNVLLKLRTVLSIELAVANLDHGLRGEKPGEEAEMIKKFCADKAVPFYHERRDVKKYMAEHGGFSLEQAARKVRYGFLRDIKTRIHADTIALAHNRDDLTETILLRLARGTGLKGIVGLKPSSCDLIRPMLSCDIQQIIDYVTINRITFMEDETNCEDTFERNFLRLKIVPEFKKLNSAFNEAIWRFFENTLDTHSWVESEIHRTLESFTKMDGVFFIAHEELCKIHKGLLFECVRELVSKMSFDDYPPSRERIEAFYELLSKREGGQIVEFKEDIKVSKVGKYVFFFNGKLNFESLGSFRIDSLPYELNFGDWNLTLKRGGYFSQSLDGGCLSVCDLKKLDFPLLLRPLRENDEIIPFGMGKAKKIKQVVTEKGLKGFLGKIQVLENNRGDILWVPGVLTSELCRVEPSSSDMAIFSLERR